MIALKDKCGEIYQLRHPNGFAYAAIFGSVEDVIAAKNLHKLVGARLSSIRVIE